MVSLEDELWPGCELMQLSTTLRGGLELPLPLGRAGSYLDVLAPERVVLILVEGDTSTASELHKHCTPDLEGLEGEERHGRVEALPLWNYCRLVLACVELALELVRVLVCQETSRLQIALGRC